MKFQVDLAVDGGSPVLGGGLAHLHGEIEHHGGILRRLLQQLESARVPEDAVRRGRGLPALSSLLNRKAIVTMREECPCLPISLLRQEALLTISPPSTCF